MTPAKVGKLLKELYDKLWQAFGPQGWWPGETPFEVAVGAILTQNTNWGNVARAIAALKDRDLLEPQALHDLPEAELARLIRPAGYYNLKARRVKNFLALLQGRYQGSMEVMAGDDLEDLRHRLLEVKGIGPETADSILLYALNKPTFVVDAYTFRILSRHQLLPEACLTRSCSGSSWIIWPPTSGSIRNITPCWCGWARSSAGPNPGASPVCWRVGLKSFKFRVSRLFSRQGARNVT